MKLIAGLGNIGEKYLYTRHNVGFMLLDKIALDNNLTFRENSKLKAFITNFKDGQNDYILIKPTTYMNLSGEAVRAVADYYKISKEDILIVYDDLSIDLGRMRFRANGSDGGHNGIKSIIHHLGSQDIARLKIGIGPQPNLPAEAFVLQNFSKEELVKLKEVLIRAKDGLSYYFRYGINIAQNKFN